MTTIVIEIRNVTKRFSVQQPFYKQFLNPFGGGEKACVLDKVSFWVESGEILGIVGPNGAGKTTLLRILANLLSPDSGEINICGCSLKGNSRHLRSKIGYASSDERSFFWRLTGRENLEFFARLYGLSHSQVRQRTSKLLAQFDFGNKADRLFRDYSTGMRKKISVIRALLHEPAVLLLDEVTNSLDPASAKMVKDLIRKYVSGNKSCVAIWSTHRLEEISQVCDFVMTIESGKVCQHSLAGNVKAFSEDNADYVLRARNMNGQLHAFCQQLCSSARVKSISNEIIFNGISEAEFSRIVTMAVKEFGVYITFAGCVTKTKKHVGAFK